MVGESPEQDAENQGQVAAAGVGSNNWLWVTTALGVGGVLLLARNWWVELQDDPQTLAVLAVVVAFWGVFQTSSGRWQRQVAGLELESIADELGGSWKGKVEVADRRRLPEGTEDGQLRLPEGTADRLADRALAEHRAPAWLGLGATTLISLGLAGTFLGLSLGLIDALPFLNGKDLIEANFDQPEAFKEAERLMKECSAWDEGKVWKNVECAIKKLLDGAKLAFIKSLLGIFLALLWNFRLQEVHSAEDVLRERVLGRLNQRYPPTTPEELLSEGTTKQTTAIRELGVTLSDALKDWKSAQDSANATIQVHVASVDQKLTSFAKGVRSEATTSRAAQAAHATAILATLTESKQEHGQALVRLENSILAAMTLKKTGDEARTAELIGAVKTGARVIDGRLMSIDEQSAARLTETMQQHVQALVRLENSILATMTLKKTGDEARAVELIGAVQAGAQSIDSSLRSIDEQSAARDGMRDALIVGLRGDDEASVAELLSKLNALVDTVQDLGDAMPEQIGVHAGTQVGSTLQPKLAELSQVLQALGSTGKEAIGDAFKDNMGGEVTELRSALLQVTAAMTQLPGLLADGSRDAAETLRAASGTGAAQLTTAAGEMAVQASAAGESVRDLRDVLRETHSLVESLKAGGADLSSSFERVTVPLQGLPGTLETARSGIADAGTAAQAAAQGLERSGKEAASALSDAAGKLVASAEEAGGTLARSAATAGELLSEATSTAGATLSGAATQAGQVMTAGGTQLAGQVESAGRVLQEGITTELASIRDALRVQRDAQHEAMEAWKAEREAVMEGAELARLRVTDLEESASSFRDSVDALRTSCQATVEKLESVTGTQQAGADKAIEDLLSAVGAFSTALQSNEQTIKDAGLQSVATTEQVTAAAARQVADALTEGAIGLERAMARATELGDAISSHSTVLRQSLAAANVSAESLEAHGRILVDSGKALRSELDGVTAPLALVRGGLEKVVPAIDSATRSMAEEGRSLSGLGESLRDHADVLEKQTEGQIRILEARTAELEGLHEKLGGQWTGHVQRMAEAHDKVKLAWQQAMQAATIGLDDNAKHVATYAERVEKALGLNHNIVGLNETLQEVADTLSELGPLLQGLGVEVGRLRGSVDALEGLDG